MSFLKELKRDYKTALRAYLKAEKEGDKETMQRMSHELIRIADAIEYAQDC